MDQNNTSFVEYCNKRLTNSLITGIPKIANTMNSQRKAFKCIVFFLSIAGFLWQTFTFLEIYLAYPVVQHVTIEYPEVIGAPAVTLCNRSRFKRQPFCRAVPQECLDKMGYAAIFNCVERRTKYCPLEIPEGYDISRTPKRSTATQLNPSIELLRALGPQSQLDLLEKCTIERGAQSITCNDSIMIQVVYEGLPYKCFTFFSLIDDPNKDPENLSLTDYYSFRLNLHAEEDMSPDLLTAAFISVHDPHRLKNPFVEYVALHTGYSYRMYVTMQHIMNSPPPYETKCVDYKTLWKENGGRGPLSKMECIQLCMIDAMLNESGCLSRAIVYPNNFNYCYPLENYNATEELMTLCESSCNEGCEVTEYFMTYETTGNLGEKLCKELDFHCKQSYLDLEIKFTRLTDERLISEPMFSSEELPSYIGGYMGLWLGISLITLFDVIEILVDIFVYAVIKWKKRETIILNYEDDKQM